VSNIFFFTEDINFRLRAIRKIRKWISFIIENEGGTYENINFIFTSDSFLHQINVEYLNHDTLTDIITFDYGEGVAPINSDIYISIDRCKENSKQLKLKFTDELHRLLAHGILHLLGYKDKKPSEKKQMTAKEDYYLSLRSEFGI